MGLGDWRFGEQDWRFEEKEASASQTVVIPPEQIASAGSRQAGIVKLTVTFRTIENQQPVRMTFGLRT